jgi:NAD-reducing hydrogenase small subunit
MSFLDMDERLIKLAEKIELVYSPIADIKLDNFPEKIDVALVTGAIGNEEDLHKLKMVRERADFVIALGDCAVTGNVPSYRNLAGRDAVLECAYDDEVPTENVPALLKLDLPLHKYVNIDLFVPGCPPSADAIYYVLSELLAGRTPEPLELTRFGA